VGRLHYGAVGDEDGRGATGNGAGVRRPTAARGRREGRRPEVGEDPDKRAPLVCERERGGREEAALRAAWAGSRLGRGLGWVDRLDLFFFLFFFSNPFSNLFQTF
jgi:hypothetical protein